MDSKMSGKIKNIIKYIALPAFFGLFLNVCISAGPANAATFTVTNNLDTGAGSLRQAITDANAATGADTINFNIPGGGVQTINITSNLPFVTGPTTIDGCTQPGANCNTWPLQLKLQLSGNDSTTSVGPYMGIRFNGVAASGSTLRGMVINHIGAFSGVLWIVSSIGANNVTIQSNHIGTDVAGTASAQVTADHGILLSTTQNNIVGGSVLGQGNVIASKNNAIFTGATTGTEIKGNYIGIGSDGSTVLPNTEGIFVQGNDTNMTIGGTTAPERNVISGNSIRGIDIRGSTSGDGYRIIGNYIGTDATGMIAKPNGFVGVGFSTGAKHVTVGGSTPAERNVISGNNGHGVASEILSAPNDSTVIKGNYIGVAADGITPLGNKAHGVVVQFTTATPTMIGGPNASDRNVIANNGGDGVLVTSTATNPVVVQNNWIGLNTNGADAGNAVHGVESSGGNISLINGNVISGNAAEGVLLNNSAPNAVITGNIIGLNPTGTAVVKNDVTGLGIVSSTGAVTNDIIGGSTPAERNIISGNGFTAVQLTDVSGNTVKGNYIGTDITGTIAFPNGLDLGGSSAVGVTKVNATTMDNNVIGGTTAGERNIISGNKGGIYFDHIPTGSTGNKVIGNYIGVDVSGNTALANAQWGIATTASHGISIGGANPGEGNVISGNGQHGIGFISGSSDMSVKGNYIGVGADGLTALGNAFHGIFLADTSSNITIGGSTAGERNVLSSNGFGGVTAQGTATNSSIKGNYIGVAADGTTPRGNGSPGVWFDGSSSMTVGGTTAGERNVISSNGAFGVAAVGGTNNVTVQGNYIGVAADGVTPRGNASMGVVTNGATNMKVGGVATGEANIIANTTGGPGVVVYASTDIDITVRGNSIYDNAGLGIDLGLDGVTNNDPTDADSGPNTLLNYPEIKSVTYAGGQYTVEYYLDVPAGNYKVDFYGNDTVDPSGHGEGKNYLAAQPVTHPGGGAKLFTATFSAAQYAAIAATTTTGDPSTSEFSGVAALISGNVTESLGGTNMAGITVKLLDAAGNPVDFGSGPVTAVTDANGNYSFSVPTGSYKVEFVPPTNYTCQTPTGCQSAQIDTVSGGTYTQNAVLAPAPIVANDDNFSGTPINLDTGGTVGSVLTNDTLGGNPVNSADITISITNDGGLTGATIDANGNIQVPAGVAPGSYSVTYQICQVNAPANCDTAIATIVVAPKAVDDTASTPAATALNGSVATNDSYATGSTFSAVTGPTNGTLTLNTDGTYTYMPNAGFAGTDTFTYQVCLPAPNDTVCDSATVTVTVNSTINANDDDFSASPIPTGGGTTPTVLTNDQVNGAAITDPNQVVLTLINNGGLTGTTLNADGTLTVPANEPAGSYTLTYQICLASDNTICDTATVTVVIAPNAVDDTATTPFNTPLNGNVASNDNVASGSTFSTVTGPTNGTLTLNTDGTYTYTPNAGFVGTDTFTYQVCLPAPNDTVCDTATVTIAVGPNAVDDTATTPNATALNGDVSTNDIFATGSTFSTTVNPANGTVTMNADGTYTYTPNAGFAGTDQFMYQVCAPAPNATLCDTAVVSVTVGPDAVDDTANTHFGTALNGNVTANDVYETGSTFTVATNPTNGTLTLNSDGTYTYTPNAGFVGTDTFTYQVCAPAPNDTLCDTATVTITVSEATPPTAQNVTATTAAGTPVTVNVLSSVTPGDGALDPSTVCIITPTGCVKNLTVPGEGTYVVNADGTITFTPAPGFTGTSTITWRVTDANGLTAQGTLTITVTPVAPDTGVNFHINPLMVALAALIAGSLGFAAYRTRKALR